MDVQHQQPSIQYFQNGASPYLMFYVPVLGNEFNQMAQSLLGKELQNISLKSDSPKQREYSDIRSTINLEDQIEKIMKAKQRES